MEIINTIKSWFDKNKHVKYVHRFGSNNKASLKKSERSGCFYCQQVFASDSIEEWIDGGKTAICPFCGVDSVIGDYDCVEITDPKFLDKMWKYWFAVR